MSKITLSAIREATEKKYAATEIDLEDAKGTVVVLHNVLRLSKAERKEIVGVGERLKADEDGEGADMFEVLASALRVASRGSKAAEALIEAADGDAAFLMEVFNEYIKATDLGEAQDSES